MVLGHFIAWQQHKVKLTPCNIVTNPSIIIDKSVYTTGLVKAILMAYCFNISSFVNNICYISGYLYVLSCFISSNELE